MSVVSAQMLERMRGEVDDHDLAARLERARRFGDRARRVGGEVQHLVECHRIDRGFIERECVHVGVANVAVAQTRAFEIGARDLEHFAREIDTDAAFDMAAENLEHATGAGTDIH